jgi:hypothetical protein
MSAKFQKKIGRYFQIFGTLETDIDIDPVSYDIHKMDSSKSVQ